jgi:hypothetical protein
MAARLPPLAERWRKNQQNKVDHEQITKTYTPLSALCSQQLGFQTQI